MLQRRAEDTALARGRPCRYRWQWSVALIVLLVNSVGLIGSAGAAEPTRPIRIGALTDSWGRTPAVVGLRDGLVKLGYRENEQFFIGVRFTQGDLAALPAAAHELVRYGVDIIFASNTNAAQAAQKVTNRIPIVFAGVGDPVGLGLIQSFAKPGGNITGVTDLNLELGPKRLEVFREMIPGLKRVLFLYDATNAYNIVQARAYRDAARHLGIELVEQMVRTEEEAQATLAQVRQSNVDGILAPSGLSLNIPGFVHEATAQQAIPTMFEEVFFVERGGLASYSPDFYESGRQAARLVDKILKGVDPAEIPVEVNPKIELVINLRVAKALGLMIAPEVLYRADRLVR